MKTVQERYDESSLEKELTKQREVTLEIASAAGALERIATALEVLVRERTLSKNTRRIRVEFVCFKVGPPHVAVFKVAAIARAAVGDYTPIPGQPGLWERYKEDGTRAFINTSATNEGDALLYTIEVPASVVVKGGNHVDSMPDMRTEFGPRPQFTVAVDLQPDPATWGWREWIQL